MKKKKKTRIDTVDRLPPKRTIVNVRKVILARLKQLGKSRLWLSQQIGVRPATIYDFLGGDSDGAKVKTLEQVLEVLGLEVRVKE